jgi:DNA-binding transcriptional regulator YiaG
MLYIKSSLSNDERMELFSKRIEKWRKDRGLLQKEAAAKLDVSYGAWRSWERGKKQPQKLALAELERRMVQVPVKMI